MQLAFKSWGNTSPTNPTLVLLHGMGGTGTIWRPVAAGLENQFHIIAPDQRGHGDSPRVGGSPTEMAADVVESFPQLKNGCIIVGHSMGVRTSTALIRQVPNWVRGAVLVDLGLETGAGGSIGEQLYDFLKELPPGFPTRTLAREFLDTHCPDPSIAQYLLAVSQLDPSDPHKKALIFPFSNAALIDIIEKSRNYLIREDVEEISKLKIPCLFLRGTHSGVWKKAAFEKDREVADSFVSFEEVEGTGHGLPFEKRQWFVSRLKQFIDSMH